MTAQGPRIGSLCTGYGGLDLAARTVLGGSVAWVSDIDKGANKLLAYRYHDVPNLGDFTRTDWSTVAPVDVLTAGYPCQPFSGNGVRKGTEDERHLWPHIIRAIRGVRPRLVVLENVEDHLTLGFDTVLGDLAASGFDAEWCVLRASDVGAPHGRPRLFVAATDPRRQLHATAEPGRLDRAVPAERTPTGPERLAWAGAGDHENEVRADAHGARWAAYGEAVRRWERVLGRPAPAPLVERAGEQDINPPFVEWCMGLPSGLVTGVPGVTVEQQLKLLGNGVVPQQAEAALRLLLDGIR